jgi:hypothetical protein
MERLQPLQTGAIYMSNKRNNTGIKSFCSLEQLEKFLGKVCVFDLTFMDRSITGEIKEVNGDFILLEMRDGRLLCARIDCVLGFGMVKNQPQREAV